MHSVGLRFGVYSISGGVQKKLRGREDCRGGGNWGLFGTPEGILGFIWERGMLVSSSLKWRVLLNGLS